MSTRAAANAGGEEVFGERKAFTELVISASICKYHDACDFNFIGTTERNLKNWNEVSIRFVFLMFVCIPLK